ncbi:bifunctional 5,10-methylenetetrahydrofolate dehydrogenase/5,10-methenyltetrahydrofolate cyclohydrolase [Rhizobium leguminosarum]|uniref:bifunctional 5,10-methylenetetrahydrofolate dehydrogenase/5,10-methenyltetrahydrofolate cyclohydrolase n=1 Tax=Rhizobium leguminosarum TaxID=384 RepID=UPI00161D8A35|nr:bifunctional 5,10-methylenetetrahydrofolate dehydrogenase/5,10-methenyltetrahydrofolate cyclohydrolase [Rhizobium leguminosarum]MBB4342991.1 methylenetetrahydrofolate dehydrogenase (NADP+)/methenyltetrahydrofolate cyclohydrolase [Rhizobium leguminosarum]MBB6296069.1 methylenetetrahydrofolate dehydrogenase (NADP+)/methenyltetrahydrofolate cyclohydrolase [Rhizobium leguminosarum]
MPSVLASKPLVDETAIFVKARVDAYRDQGGVPQIVVVLASDDPAAFSYAKAKERAGSRLGIAVAIEQMGSSEGQHELNERIAALSADRSVHGIILELPLRPSLNANDAMKFLDPRKDIDGLSEANVAKLAAGDEENAILPATPQACIALAESVASVRGRLIAVVGRGRTVGRPLATMLINRGATVFHCHSLTSDLATVTSSCDMIFCATGRAGLIGKAHVRAGQVIIDAGTNYAEGAVRGDVDAEAVEGIVRAYSPVPGGVGPLTSMMVFKNLLKAFDLQA